eukprot:CAMPEP_0174728892 /NCGR_PEP_ID=MMETSP1094-20130205/52613_1 /TAXON_ID=156173 /ORGANISM="Chrysochromulina brevifilum, Strain UTEX LB 985" /LENGTH=157 /DNA_ID=CAMNT_0015930901 /DNA_START=99 /DNA_END=572 /DNA_ORIENTATION=+
MMLAVVKAAPPAPGSRLIPYARARAAVHRLSLRTEQEWREWVSDNKPGITSKFSFLMPDDPDLCYPAFQSWDDWLGVPLPYDEAREVVKTLGISSQMHWWAWTRERDVELQSLRVPSRPHLFYGKAWRGYDHWLSLPEVPLVLPAGFGDNSFGGDDP